MSNMEDEKYLGREFIRQLYSKNIGVEAVKSVFEKFSSTPPDRRVAIAMSLLAIGADKSEQPFERNLALAQLGLIVRRCSLQNNDYLQRELSDIIEDWVHEICRRSGSTNGKSVAHELPPTGALLALAAVNQISGLKKCDRIIELYGKSEIGRQVLLVRLGIERVSSENGPHQ